MPTIEEELLKALLEAKYISDEDFKNQQNAQFQRSSRTDKGVSAARQVVSLKMRKLFFSILLGKKSPSSFNFVFETVHLHTTRPWFY